MDYNNNYQPPPPPQPVIKQEGYDASSPIDLTGQQASSPNDYFAPEPQSKAPLKAMSLYMSDLRGEEPEDILVELKVASMALVDEDDREMGYEVQAKEVGQALQRGPSRVEGSSCDIQVMIWKTQCLLFRSCPCVCDEGEIQADCRASFGRQ